MSSNSSQSDVGAIVAVEPRVLIVEDEGRMRELLSRVLRNWGFDVTVARSAEEAFRVSRSVNPDIVLLDLNLPGEGGLEFFSRLRERLPRVQGIVLTGYASVEAAREAIHLEVVEFLSKPCPLGDLEKAMDRALRRLMPPAKPALARATSEPGPEPTQSMHKRVPEQGLTLEQVEREHILATLARHDNNRTAAAAELGISRRTLYYKLDEYESKG